MRASPIAAMMVLGMTLGASAQVLGPGMMGPSGNLPNFNTAPPAPPPGAGPQYSAPPQYGAPPQQQQPPCFQEFAPMRQEAEKRAGVLKVAIQKKVGREEACTLIKSFAVAEAKVVNFVTKNAQSCGIPSQAVQQMTENHKRTAKMQSQVCSGGATAGGPPRPTGPGLSEALGTARAGTLDPLAPQSGALDTLTGNVLSR